jgi:hypothetical protein
LVDLGRKHGVPVYRLGETGGDQLTVAPHLSVGLAEALTTYNTALEGLVSGSKVAAAG